MSPGSIKHLYKHLDPRYVNLGEKATSAATANTALNANNAATANTAMNANNANQLDGKDSTEFLGATAKAADSDNLDGIDFTGFIQGRGGFEYRQSATITTNFGVVNLVVPFGTLRLSCRFSTSAPYTNSEPLGVPATSMCSNK